MTNEVMHDRFRSGTLQIQLSTTEYEQARQQTIKAMRKRLEIVKPSSDQFSVQFNPATQVVIRTLLWAKAFILLSCKDWGSR